MYNSRTFYMAKPHAGLTIGWKVDENMAPRYWLQNGAKSGGQADADLVHLPSASMAHHTAIIAQSGSGKSFFLGRLIEEILLQTRAKCIIFDPNADFSRISDVADESLWTSAGYDVRKGRGRLPHEGSRADFEKEWCKVPVRVWTGAKSQRNNSSQQALKIPVSLLSAEFLAEELDPRFRSDLHLCQQVVGQMEQLYRINSAAAENINLVEKLQILLEYAKNSRYGRTLFEKEFPAIDLTTVEQSLKGKWKGVLSPVVARTLFDLIPWATASLFLHSFDLSSHVPAFQFEKKLKDVVTADLDRRREDLYEALQRLANDVSPIVPQYYISRLETLHSARILDRGLVKKETSVADVQVIDLPSLKGRDTQLLAVDYLLTSLWDKARTEWAIAVAQPAEKDGRVPTFVVVDEAHNLIAHEPRSLAERVVRERFRTIAAEGRKLGIFLILVSQNPTKLDSFVLSECENRALMRLNSEAVLERAKKDLGLDHLSQKTLQTCLRLGLGRVLIEGPWSPEGPLFLFSAARRTVEGGRSLRDEHWAAEPDRRDPSPGAEKTASKSQDAAVAKAKPNKPGPAGKESGKGDDPS